VQLLVKTRLRYLRLAEETGKRSGDCNQAEVKAAQGQGDLIFVELVSKTWFVEEVNQTVSNVPKTYPTTCSSTDGSHCSERLITDFWRSASRSSRLSLHLFPQIALHLTVTGAV